MKKYSDEVIITALKKSAGMVTYAAKLLKVDYTTLYSWLKKYPVLEKARQEAIEANLDLAETKLLSNIKAGKEASIFFYLKCKGKDRGYIERQQIEHSGRDGQPITMKSETINKFDLSGLTDKELEVLENLGSKLKGQESDGSSK